MANLLSACLVFSSFCGMAVISAPVEGGLSLAERYLRKYKYIEDVRATREAVSGALELFQHNNNLQVSGTLDEKTLERMENPPCNDDPEGDNDGMDRRTRRYVLARGVKWTKSDVTFNVVNAPPTLSIGDVEDTFRRAFDAWQNVCGLTFHSVRSDTSDIQILFARGYHGDHQNFDGADGLLGHAFIPIDNGEGLWGDIHLDADEQWVLTTGGKNLYQVALHEIGHTLALGHSYPNTVMNALYQVTYNPNIQLTADDIMGVQALYGPNDQGGPIVEELPTESNDVMEDDNCHANVDAITKMDDNSIFAFSGQEVYHLLAPKHFVNGFPRPLSQAFQGMESVTKIDAAVYWSRFSKLYIFAGSQYYRYSYGAGQTTAYPKPIDVGYPREISHVWGGIPNDLDAVTLLDDDTLLFFKDNVIFKFGNHQNQFRIFPEYPKHIALAEHWNLLSSVDVQAVFRWFGDNYFALSGDEYRVINNKVGNLSPGSPGSFGVDWFGCDMLEEK